ncbi:hypothetical protein WUBG_05553 [Wuchereria bancrofti]|uniref:BACK domain-containing protein n=1 Tax=Wuchereria bancrofti TaxID=6293 RepID=J9F875_WUCBA|nr:hypothetical protein WUBG_05553 [Wuchereria bancrofti]
MNLIVQHVIEKVEKGPRSNLLLALNLVSSDWSMFLRINEASALVESAAENISEVAISTFFYILPAAVLVMLYSRCDVEISSEVELSQRFIHWLKKMIRTDSEAEILFSCIRTPFLSPKDREIIREKCVGLPKSVDNLFLSTHIYITTLFITYNNHFSSQYPILPTMIASNTAKLPLLFD